MARKRTPKVSPIHVAGDIGTPELHRNAAVAINNKIARVLPPMEVYRSKRYIDPHHYEAGERLYLDFSYSGLDPRVPSLLDDSRGGGLSFGEARLEARQRYHQAKRHIVRQIGADEWMLIERVVCYGWHRYEAARFIAPRSSAKLRQTFLAILDELARHYGIQIP